MYQDYLNKVESLLGYGLIQDIDIEKFKTFSKSILLGNQFITVTNIINQEFLSEYTNGVERVLKIKNSEFTPQKLYEIIRDSHKPQAFIFSLFAISLLNEPEFKTHAEVAYGVRFSGNIEGRHIRLERFCIVLLTDQGIPSHMIDRWTYLPSRNPSEYLEYSFYSKQNQALVERSYELFYDKWTDYLQLRLTNKQQDSIRALMNNEYITRDQAADSLGISKDAFDERIQYIKEKINKFITRTIPDSLQQLKAVEYEDEDTILKASLFELLEQEPWISSEKQLLHFVRKYNLLQL